MSHQPEDLISPEDEAEIHRAAITGMSEHHLDILGKVISSMEAHPEHVTPEDIYILGKTLELHKAWLKQQGIGLPQPDVD